MISVSPKPSKAFINFLFIFIIPSLTYAQDFQAPADKFELNHFNLQLPIPHKNTITQVQGDELKHYASQYFYLNPANNGMVFFVPSNGITTHNSHYPRTELRDQHEWNFIGQHTLSATLTVQEQPNSKKIIVGQVHGDHKGTEAVKIWWINGDLIVGVKPEVNAKEYRVTYIKNVALNEKFSYQIAQSGKNVIVTINNISHSFTFGDSWNTEQVYFKAGNYLQDNSTIPISIGRVEFYTLKVHND